MKQQPEPTNFYELVAKPGEEFLKKYPMPTKKQLESHPYWRRSLIEMRKAYSSICAYSCHWVPPDTGWNTVEHFNPTSKYPNQAYKWANLRFVCGTLNGRKSNFEDVLDPFNIESGWFAIDFPSLMVVPGPSASQEVIEKIYSTIRRLKLNDENTCLSNRLNWLKNYIIFDGKIEHLEKHAPFLARELIRQNLAERIKHTLIVEDDPLYAY